MADSSRKPAWYDPGLSTAHRPHSTNGDQSWYRWQYRTSAVVHHPTSVQVVTRREGGREGERERQKERDGTR
eukprot:603616-Rhodomonas_salina.1